MAPALPICTFFAGALGIVPLTGANARIFQVGTAAYSEQKKSPQKDSAGNTFTPETDIKAIILKEKN